MSSRHASQSGRCWLMMAPPRQMARRTTGAMLAGGGASQPLGSTAPLRHLCRARDERTTRQTVTSHAPHGRCWLKPPTRQQTAPSPAGRVVARSREGTGPQIAVRRSSEMSGLAWWAFPRCHPHCSTLPSGGKEPLLPVVLVARRPSAQPTCLARAGAPRGSGFLRPATPGLVRSAMVSPRLALSLGRYWPAARYSSPSSWAWAHCSRPSCDLSSIARISSRC